MFTVYVLCSESSGRHYIGQTKDLGKRILEHNEGLARYTRNRGPWQLVYTEAYCTRAAAMKRERELKSGKGRQWLKDNLTD